MAESKAASLRILHCPTSIGGQPPSLARAERRLGHESRCVVFQANPFGYPVDEVLLDGTEGFLGREWGRAKLLARALRGFDLVHFNFGSSLAPVPDAPQTGASMRSRIKSLVHNAYARMYGDIDLKLLRRFNKVIAVTFQGSDARQQDFCQEHFEICIQVPDSAWRDDYNRKRIAVFDRYAHLIYACNPDLMHVLPERTRFLPYGNVDVKRIALVQPDNPRPVLIHAPSNRNTKGTSYILEAVQRLEQEGLDFEFRLIEGVSNEEAMKLYAGADLVIDQLLAGWYGGFAVEVMAMGKPVIAYIRDMDLKFLPKTMREELPIINATPDAIHLVLRNWVNKDAAELRAHGVTSQAFVRKWHDPDTIGAGLIEDYLSVLGAAFVGKIGPNHLEGNIGLSADENS